MNPLCAKCLHRDDKSDSDACADCKVLGGIKDNWEEGPQQKQEAAPSEEADMSLLANPSVSIMSVHPCPRCGGSGKEPMLPRRRDILGEQDCSSCKGRGVQVSLTQPTTTSIQE